MKIYFKFAYYKYERGLCKVSPIILFDRLINTLKNYKGYRFIP